jgi:Zn-dependent peptidase ImmA (M78 family)
MKLKSTIEQHIKDLTKDCYDQHMLLLEKLCAKLNLKCFESDFDDDKVSGLLMKDEGKDSYSIYVNKKHPLSRNRFTIAHEIGHYLSYLNNSYSEKELKDNGQFTDYSMMWRHENIKSKAETEANLIAAKILMPEDKVAAFMQQNMTPEEMAKLFYVSPSAMTIRLKTLYPDLMVV